MWGVHAGLRQAVSAVKTMLSLSETLLAVGTLAVGRNTFTIRFEANVPVPAHDSGTMG